MSFDTSWEDKIYSQQNRFNKYPYGELVSIFFNSLKFLPEDKLLNKNNIKVLELGCGAANNLWFIAELGFDTYGIDGSERVCEIAQAQCVQRNVNVNIQHTDFDNLPFEDNTFDIIIDREATYCGTFQNIKKWWKNADRVLKKNGIIISFLFSDDNPDCLKIKQNMLKATEIEPNTYKDIEKGTFHQTGVVHFTSYNELFDIFSFCDIQYINKNSSLTVYNQCDNQFNYAEWIVVGIKR